MPIIAILADIHANLKAMTAVVEEATRLGCDKIVLGGDLVGYGSEPSECVALAMHRGLSGVRGNHDEWALRLRKQDQAVLPQRLKEDTMIKSLLHAAHSLTSSQALWLEARPYFQTLPSAILVHASLDEPRKWHYVETPSDALPSIQLLRGRKKHIAFCGHTHVQKIFYDLSDGRQISQVGERSYLIPPGLATVITVGSVGQPRDEDRDGGASWTIWDSDYRIVEFRRTQF